MSLIRLLQQLQRNELPAGSYDDCPYKGSTPSIVIRRLPGCMSPVYIPAKSVISYRRDKELGLVKEV
ncbi:hypothetical protein KC19_6G055300 [Ceratodon purpureus]|uniref:Uncharacterized protein n=1 Tax=Ceratodon purpureus TaxID=3225 RepID=A0A8T0HB11_CERPU|nr:hypothetical protein KC19_6G055300 [Ceratodon purpureus]